MYYNIIINERLKISTANNILYWRVAASIIVDFLIFIIILTYIIYVTTCPFYLN